MKKQTKLEKATGDMIGALELLHAFQEDLEERPARKTVAERKAARVANAKYELWRKGGK